MQNPLNLGTASGNPKLAFEKFLSKFKKAFGDGEVATLLESIYNKSTAGKKEMLAFSKNTLRYAPVELCEHCGLQSQICNKPANCPVFREMQRKKLIETELKRRENKRHRQIHKISSSTVDVDRLYQEVESNGGFQTCCGQLDTPSSSKWVNIARSMGFIDETSPPGRGRCVASQLKMIFCEKWPDHAMQAPPEYTDFFRSYHLRRTANANRRRVTEGKKKHDGFCKYCGKIVTSHASIHCPLVAHPLLQIKFTVAKDDGSGEKDTVAFFDKMVEGADRSADSEGRCNSCGKIGCNLSKCPMRFRNGFRRKKRQMSEAKVLLNIPKNKRMRTRNVSLMSGGFFSESI